MLSFEQYQKQGEKNREFKEHIDTHLGEIRNQELKKMGVELTDNSEECDSYNECDSVYAIGNGAATILYLFVMISGAIFNDKLLIWIMATIIWMCHIYRYNIKKWRKK